MSQIYQDNKLYGLFFANVSLEGITHFLIKAGPLLGVLLTLLQIAVAAITVWHWARQHLLKQKQHHEKTPPPDTTGSGI